MKKVIIGTVLLLTTTLSAFSQTKNITVAGRVIEDDTCLLYTSPSPRDCS